MTFDRETHHGNTSASAPPQEPDSSLTLTARFRDCGLEADFQQAQFDQVRKIMAGVALAGLLGAILSLYGTYLQFGTSSWVFQNGLWFRLPLIIMAVAALLAFLTQSHRNWLYTWHTLLLIWGFATIALRMTVPYEGEETLLALFNVSRDGVMLLLIVSLYALTLIPGWFMINVLVTSLSLAGFLFLASLGSTTSDDVLKLVLVSVTGFAFILVIANAVRRLTRQTYLAHRQLRNANQMLEHLSQTDDLTGCANRRHFFHRGNLEFGKALRYHWPLSVIAIDIDHFKLINDQHGHATGDRVLAAFATLLQRDLREPDLPARIGGEEFLILLPGTDKSGALLLAERLREESESSPINTDRGPVLVKASFGVADLASSGATDFYGLISEADTALYLAKQNGRNRVMEAPVEA